MSMTKADIMEWLEPMDDDDVIAIDDGGLALVLVSSPDAVYLEIGGIPEEED